MSNPPTGRGRGRARGQARGAPTDSGQQRPGGPPAQGPPQTHSQQGAIPRVGQYRPAPQPTQPAWGQQQRAPPPSQAQSAGRANIRGSGEAAPTVEVQHVGTTSGNGNGNGNSSGLRRGNVRGKRQLHETVVRTRPDTLATKSGSFGERVQLQANYFKLLSTTKFVLFQYRVDFAPEEDRTIVKKALFRKAVKDVFKGYIFDGTVVFSVQRVEKDFFELFVKDEQKPDPVRITVRLVSDVALGDVKYIQVFNILMRKCLGHLQLQLVGRDYYDAKAAIAVEQYKLQLWPGYVTSIRQHENEILMCAEVSHKVMRFDTALDLFLECQQKDRRNVKELFQSKIIGSVVLTEYNNRTYRIDDVDFNATLSSTFDKRDGSKVSYKEYFRSKYGINDMGPDFQPMLISRAKPREIRCGLSETIYLVPRLCRMTGLTDAQRSNFNVMRALADYTRMGPTARVERLHGFSKRLVRNEEIMQDLKSWDLQLAEKIINFAGRVLPPETVKGYQCEYSAGPEADWTRELRSRPMTSRNNPKDWAVVVPNRASKSVSFFVQTLIKAARGMQFHLPQPNVYEIQDDRINSYLSAIQELTAGKKPSIVMCILPRNNSDIYGAIKKRCCVDTPVLTQVMVQRNVESKGVMSIATKVAIQMNAKLGGVPWTVPLPLKNIMVVGFDVCHDTTNKSRSYGAFVASLTQEVGHYFSTVAPHGSGEELSNEFGINVIKCCKAFQQKNGCLPERIIVYRDGVGEGHLQHVIEHEVKMLVSQLNDFYKGQNPVKLAFIVVNKRINTRIFQNENNPRPGTVVDDVITLPERYDFFIVSQCVRQGTVSPTSYNILYDTLGLDADKMQRLTYKLCHMYFNWSGTVRVPAPCQYAHKLAFLVGQFLHRNPSSALENFLYFL